MQRWHHVVLFSTLGVVLYVVLYGSQQTHIFARPDAHASTIAITAPVLDQIRQTLPTRAASQQCAAQLAPAIQHWIDSEILLREALRLGLQRIDPVVKKRVQMNLEFLEQSVPDADGMEQPQVQTMLRQDLVIRRRLVERMQAIIASIEPSQPGTNQLLAFLQAHPERYARTGYRLEHAYFSAADFPYPVVEALYQRWQESNSIPDIESPGPAAFTSPHHILTVANLRRLFGAAIAATITDMHSSGVLPLQFTASGYHFIRVLEVSPQQLPQLANIRARVTRDYLTIHQQQAFAETMAQLRQRYRIVYDPALETACVGAQVARR